MKKFLLVLVLGLVLGVFFVPRLHKGKSAEEWYGEFKRMETKHNVIKSDFDGLKGCLRAIESKLFKSSGTTVDEITECIEKYG